MIIYVLLLLLSAGGITLVGIRLHRADHLYRVRHNYTAATEAPSVSVCIPARNEMHAMASCLERVLASDYKKMEIIVYDDHSHDDTSLIIKSFAHAGVRFVEGSRLPEGWLGRNHAFDSLAREASGTYVLFMDVDTFIAPTTISELVGYLVTKKLEMVSVIPSAHRLRPMAALFGHLRFFWEIVLSHTNRPTVSGMLWMMKRSTFLDDYDGFNRLKLSVQPEIDIAQLLGTARYHCLLPAARLGVAYEKRLSSQLETSTRLLRPLSGDTFFERARFVMLLILFNVPFWGLVAMLVFDGLSWLSLVWMSVLVFSMAMYAYYHLLMKMRWWLLGGVLWPYIAMRELALYVISIAAYASGRVTWKGRRITSSTLRRK